MSLHQPILEHSAVLFWARLLIHLLTYVQRLPGFNIDIRRRVRLFDGYVIEHHGVGLRNGPVFCGLPVLAPRFVQTAERSLPPSGFQGCWIIGTREDWSRNHETDLGISGFEWEKESPTYSGSRGSSRIRWR
jgi:hypothetical protein